LVFASDFKEIGMLFRQLIDQETSTYTYLLADQDTLEAVLIDPVLEQTGRDLKLLEELGLNLRYILETHVHADHITGAAILRRSTGARSVLAAAAGVSCADDQVNHGDRLRFGRYELQVRSTPGHTSGCLTFVLEGDEERFAFTGDALLIRGCGRTDFQQGDARTLYRSIHRQIYTLPDQTRIYPGHDYHGHTSTTVAEEKHLNPRLNEDVSEGQFIEIMNSLDLAYPKKIDVALPLNLACGEAQERQMLESPR
jgi:sulfur dioxygenase